MSSLILPAEQDMRRPLVASVHWRRRCVALAATLALHLGLGALLLAHWQVGEPPAPQVSTVQLQLLTLAPPAPPAPPVALPEPPPVQSAQPDPAIERQRLEQAALARKRAEQQRLEQEQQRQREAQQREQERQRREAEAREQLEQQRLAEAREQAERQRAAAAAERARQAEAAAASREFLPIAKQAPAYPQRALDKGLEGQCTVRYRVNEQGRVENPEAEPDCHPLFVRPSLNAAKSFRYQPRVIDGRAVAVSNVRNTFTYRIE
ncbi:energy transducer TonB [Ectopseudomonas hydrolytica]|uniref:Protein TonB n=1 Tax=Ectopseudomonas mendocina (strain ymp) TaxID=399739 RepID=A4XZP1_ECTM1